MTTEKDLKERAEYWMFEIWYKRDLSKFDLIHDQNFIDKSPENRKNDRNSYKKSIEELFASFPDWEATVKDLIIDSNQNKVAVRWEAKGTHLGTFYDIPPTKKIIQFTGIEIITIKNGLITERWENGMD